MKKIFLINFLYSRISFFILFLLCGGIVFGFVKNHFKNVAVDGEIEKTAFEINDLSKKNRETKDLIAYYESDFFIEEQAKQSLDLQKKDEKVVIISDEVLAELFKATDKDFSPVATDDQSGYTKVQTDVLLSPYILWWRYFFK